MRLIRSLFLGSLFSLLLSAAPARADVPFCLQDGLNNPLRRVWVQHLFTDYLTNDQGCVTIPTILAFVTVRVFAHNSVVRMETLGLLYSEEIKNIRPGETRVPLVPRMWQVADRVLGAYDNGLREFAPWNGSAFPGGTKREPGWGEPPVLRLSFPDLTPDLTYVEPARPLIHLNARDENASDVIAHELGHLLHFSRLSLTMRGTITLGYAQFLASPRGTRHCFHKPTTPLVAWVEAFGHFAFEYQAAPPGPGKRAAFYQRARDLRGNLNTSPTCMTANPTAPGTGSDVEGAVFMTLFHDFAGQAAVGLDYVVASYVDCNVLDIQGYGACIKDRFGASSEVYNALVCAAARNGITLEAAEPGDGLPEAGDRFGSVVARGDFDEDGFEDLAVGAPNETVGTLAQAGMVTVIFESPAGLTAQCRTSFSQDSRGIPGAAEAGDHFGAALAVGDFNGDGQSDLAIGAPGEDIEPVVDAGYVVVIPGSKHGLDFGASTGWWKGKPGILREMRQGDMLGSSLVAGNLVGDSRTDLAIGIPRDDVREPDGGAVLIVRGSSTGLTETSNELLTRGTSSVAFERFGSTLAAGDFDRDTPLLGDERPVSNRDDLAVGSPGLRVAGNLSAGAVTLFYGRPDGLVGTISRTFDQSMPSIPGEAGANKSFGASLAFGDFDGDAQDDLAIGAPGEQVGAAPAAGAVIVLYGQLSRTSDPSTQLWSKDTPGVAGASAAGDRMGSSLATGDFDSDGRDDLAVGIPRNDLTGSGGVHTEDAGVVLILYGAPTHLEGRVGIPAGLDDGRSMLSSQAQLQDFAEDGDLFGGSLAAGDFDGDGRIDLAIGVPYESVGATMEAGAVNVMRGAATGLGIVGNQLWQQGQ